MANTDNSCSGIEVNDFFSQSKGHLGMLLAMQSKMQNELFQKHGMKPFSEMTIKELATYWLSNKHCMEDELGEALDALGGVKDGIGSAAWKHWKEANHKKASAMKLSDLSESDLKELKMELIDALHFMLIFFVSIGMTQEDIFNMYCAKNIENLRRWDNGY